MMNKLFYFLLLVAILLSGSLICYSQTGTIKGKVRNKDGILHAATVLLGSKMQLTDNKGEFSFLVNAGTYFLTVTHTGYERIDKEIKVETGITQIVEIIMSPDELMGEIVVLGSRSNTTLNNLNSTVPVDVISSKQLTQTGQASLVQMLDFVAPSFNASRQVANQPVTLRGLDPEHVLILLNGTRYHNTAWINPGNKSGQLGRGSVANDLNSIPFSAIEKIEILRDGSSAQYGSDAIAGVIDIQLKESTGKTFVQLHTGQYYKGDGNNLVFGINRGVVLPAKNHPNSDQKGFLDISGDFGCQGRTDHGGRYDSTVYFDPPANASLSVKNVFFAKDSLRIVQRRFDRHVVASNLGNPKINHYALLINGAYPVSNHTSIFWTAAVNNRLVNSRSSYVFPKSVKQVDTALFPDGFQPILKANNIDVSEITGIRGMTINNWHWKVSSSFGYNSVSNYAENTNNASQSYLGKNAPTTFYAGKYAYEQLTNELNFSKGFYLLPNRRRLLNLGFGAEWRFEHYRTFQGEDASWRNYDPTKTMAGGAQASFGIDTNNVVNKNRNMAGGYIDLESELNHHLLLDLAGRYERYSDYGGNFAGKLAARYKFTDKFSLRASLSNGFRAPSLQQRFYTATTAAFSTIAGATATVIRGVFPENNQVTRALNIPYLKPENTVNLSIGFTASFLNHFNILVDAYGIQIKNRIIISGIFDRKNIPIINTILSAYPDLSQIDQVQFFTNAINTRSAGVDLAIKGKWYINKSTFGFMLAANFIQTNVFGKIQTSDKIPVDSLNTLFSADGKASLERGQPGSKIILSISYKIGKTECIISNTRFGSTSTASTYTNPNVVLTEFFSPKILTNININYALKKWLTITAGANNIFNVYPDQLKNNKKNGILIYSQEASPFGYNGGYYFAGLSINL